MKAFTFFLAISLFAIARTDQLQGSQEAWDESDDMQPMSLIDAIIKSFLKNLRATLRDTEIEDISKMISYSFVNVSLNATDISLLKADEFEHPVVKSSIIPMMIQNLTLTWKELGVSSDYNVEGTLDLDNLVSCIQVFGNGKAKVTLTEVFFTTGIKLQLRGATIKVQNKGLFNFDVSVKRAKVTLDSLLGSSHIGLFVGTLISNALPKLIDTFKMPLFHAFHDQIVDMMNSMLAGKSLSELSDFLGPQHFPLNHFDGIEENQIY